MVKAAEALCVTPAALTTRVKLLEEDLGLQLFERFEGRLRLTEAGKEVVSAAAHIDNVMSDLFDALRGKNGMLAGPVRVSLVCKWSIGYPSHGRPPHHAGVVCRPPLGSGATTCGSRRVGIYGDDGS